VDLVGIEPTTSSMPRNDEKRNLLTAKALIVGRVGKNRLNRRILLPKCYQTDLGRGLPAGDSPFTHMIVSLPHSASPIPFSAPTFNLHDARNHFERLVSRR
jgi:hypothetical protein